MISLCVDTSAFATVVLVEDGRELGRATDPNPRRHVESLGELVQKVLTSAVNVHVPDRVCVGTGPGPYTGLRAGMAFGVAFARGTQIPCLGVSSQDALALAGFDMLCAKDVQCEGGTEILVTSDAKRGEVYWGIYVQNGGDDVVAVDGPNVGSFEGALGVAHLRGAIHLETELDPVLLSRIVVSRLESKCVTLQNGFPLIPQYLRRPDVNVTTSVAFETGSLVKRNAVFKLGAMTRDQK